MALIIINLLLFNLASAEPLNLLVDYPLPKVDSIELLPSGSTRSIIKSESGFLPEVDLMTAGVEIRVRLFPILSSPFRDPYPVVKNPFFVELSNSSELLLVDKGTGKELLQSKHVKLDFLNGKILANNTEYNLVECLISVGNDKSLTEVFWDQGQVDSSGRKIEIAVKVRGNFWIVKTDFANITPRIRKMLEEKKLSRELWSVINILPLNQYLQSVLPSEVSAQWPSEAIKSQAIAARTYALYEMALARNKDKKIWDVDPTTWYQSYRGVEFRRGQSALIVETNSTNLAVKSTRHNVITYNGEVIKAYFSSNSGGVTCSAKECFNLSGDNPPYLTSVTDAPGVEKLPFGTWGAGANINRESIKDRLVLLGYPKEISVKEMIESVHGESGRVWGLRVILMDDNEIKLNRIQSSAMMTLFGPIRSYLYKLSPADENGKQQVVGHGLGHGVGMSQYGAYLFANNGWKAEQILGHFYQKTFLHQISTEEEN